MQAQITTARWWRRQDDGRIHCTLCPHGCRVGPGQSGFCRVRRHEDGRLVSLSYGHPTGFGIDPIEKKPLFHFLPGSTSLSFGTLGCTLGCRFCQNWTQSHAETTRVAGREVAPHEIVALAEREGTASISYTYNEPTVFAEYVSDTARLAREKGVRNVTVTNGYIAGDGRAEMFASIDAANVDLKAFDDGFYRKVAWGRLQPVLETIEWLRRETRIWIELTTLLIPDLNDSPEMIAAECEWILAKLGPDVPVHFTAFHPTFKMTDRGRTDPATLARARTIARESGIHHVYVGNVLNDDGQTTYCPNCGERLITRTWHDATLLNLKGSRCGNCQTEIAGVFA